MKKIHRVLRTQTMALLAVYAGLSLTILGSCYKDTGNYAYVELGEFSIDSTNAPGEYVVQQFDTLRIDPRLQYHGDRSDLDFLWTIYNPGGEGHRPVDTLSQEEHLVAPIGLFPDKYYLEFMATVRQTGRSIVHRFHVNVSGMGSGFLVLYAKDEGVDVDIMITGLLDGSQETDEVRRNLYSVANPDRPLLGNPVAIGYQEILNDQRLTIITDRDGVRVSAADMEVIREFGELFALAPPVTKPAGLAVPFGVTNPNASVGVEFVVNDGQAYANLVAFALGQESAYSLLMTTDGEYRAAPFMRWGAARTVVFDELNGRFLGAGPFSTLLSPILNTGTAFNFQDIQRDLIYMNYGFGGQYVNYAIFQDKDAPGKRYLYAADFGLSRALHLWDLSGSPGIAEATHFAFATRVPLAYYADAKCIYQFNYDWSEGVFHGGTPAWEGLPAAEEVTFLQLCYYPGENITENAKDRYLLVASYNEHTKEGKVYFLDIDLATGKIEPNPLRVFRGFGRVKDITYKY